MPLLHFNIEDVEEEISFGGSVRNALMPEKLDESDPKQVFAYSLFRPGESYKPHIHPGSSEIYYVIRGNGTAYHGPKLKPSKIRAGDVLFIPAGTIHTVKNTGRGKLEIAYFLVPGTEPTVEAPGTI